MTEQEVNVLQVLTEEAEYKERLRKKYELAELASTTLWIRTLPTFILAVHQNDDRRSLHSIVHNSTRKGMSGTYTYGGKSAHMYTFAMAGRVLITFERSMNHGSGERIGDSGESVTLWSVEEDESKYGRYHGLGYPDPLNIYRICLHSINIPIEEARQLIQTVTRAWVAGQWRLHKNDDNVFLV